MSQNPIDIRHKLCNCQKTRKKVADALIHGLALPDMQQLFAETPADFFGDRVNWLPLAAALAPNQYLTRFWHRFKEKTYIQQCDEWHRTTCALAVAQNDALEFVRLLSCDQSDDLVVRLTPDLALHLLRTVPEQAVTDLIFQQRAVTANESTLIWNFVKPKLPARAVWNRFHRSDCVRRLKRPHGVDLLRKAFLHDFNRTFALVAKCCPQKTLVILQQTEHVLNTQLRRLAEETAIARRALFFELQIPVYKWTAALRPQLHGLGSVLAVKHDRLTLTVDGKALNFTPSRRPGLFWRHRHRYNADLRGLQPLLLACRLLVERLPVDLVRLVMGYEAFWERAP